MKKFIKFFSIFLALLVLLFITAIFFVYHYINTDKIKQLLNEKVYAMTGRHLTIKGDIKWSFFPWLGIKLNNMALSNAKGFAPKDFASVKEVDAKFKLLPLISGKVEVGTVNLIGLNVNLAKNAKGVTNWQDVLDKLKTGSTKPADNAKSVTEKTQDSTTGHHLNIAVAGVNIKNAKLTWVDHQQHQNIDIYNINFNSSNIALTHAFPVNLQLNVKSNKPQLAGHIGLSGSIVLDLAHQVFSVSQFDLNAKLQGKMLPNHAFNGDITGDARADLAQQRLTLKPLRIHAYHVTVDGNVNGTGITSQPNFNGNIDIKAFNPRQLLADLGQHIQFKNSHAMRKVSLAAQFKASAKHVALNNINAQLDQTKLNGSASVQNFAKPQISFDLAANKINVDNYQLQQTANTASSSGRQPARANRSSAGFKLPVTMLRQLNLNGQIKLGQLTVADKNIKQISARVIAKNGLIRLISSTAMAFGGRYQGNGKLDVRPATPLLAFNGKVNGLQAQQLLTFKKQNKLGIKRITGTASTFANITARGIDTQQWLKTLNGQAAIDFQRGEIDGVDMEYQLSKVINQGFGLIHKKSPIAVSQNTGKTPFLDLGAKTNIKNGVANNTINIDTPLLEAVGSGNINLSNQRLAMRITAHIKAAQHNKNVVAITKMPIVVNLSGDLTHPRWQPDLQAMTRYVLQQQVKNVENKLKNKVNNQLNRIVNDKLGGQLKNVLGGF